jgi:hypothetical protein
MLIKTSGILSATVLLMTPLPEELSSVSLGINQFPPEQKISAKKSSDIDQRCNTAVRTAVNRLNEVRNIDVVYVTPINLSEFYSNYPSSAPLGITFGLEGRGIDNVMNSPQLMTNISNQLITGCPVISLVTIGRSYSSYLATFGLIGDSVREFICSADSLSGTTEMMKLRWGELYCM